MTTRQAAPVVVAQRLRRGSCGSPRGAARLVADALATVTRVRRAADGSADGAEGPVLVRADSAFYGHATVSAALKAGAAVSVTVRLDPRITAAIAAIAEYAWTTIGYTDAVFDEDSGRWISRAEVAKIPFVQRPDTIDTVTADKTHRGHAIIEQVHADLKNSALAHLPSGKFTANAAWLVLAVMAFNLTRAAAATSGPPLARATTATIRRTLIAVPAKVASSARRLTLHLPLAWPWQQPWNELFTRACRPPHTVNP